MIVHLPAYIGPGAGFAFAGSLLSVVLSFLAAVGSLALWPFRAALRLLRQNQGYKHAKIDRLIFLGLDGLDPRLTERYMEEGRMPNLVRLREMGSYSRLRTTYPALSPVAWSTFATGVNPAKHNIFDFLHRNTKSYAPELAPSIVRQSKRGPVAESRRKSQAFWTILGERSIQSTILRVPITFPPEKFDGRMLAAMCTPDLRGTQSSFSHFHEGGLAAELVGGNRYPLQSDGDWLNGNLEGPDGAEPVAFRVNRGSGILDIGGKQIPLEVGQYSDWVKLNFHAGKLGDILGVRGIARFLIVRTQPEFSLYVTPVQIDPESPALPISHPPFYASYLAKSLGSYSTLGMAEDTWALNEGVIDDHAFLDQAYLTLAEREAMFENALKRTLRGVAACVFDTSDRVQHMFFRGMDEGGETIPDLYERMDRIVGNTMKHVNAATVLFVLSDHGFCHFRRAVNVNRWLVENGYMVVTGTGEISWQSTRAYFVGLSGLYINRRGREANGIVEAVSAAPALALELAAKLSGLRDNTLEAVAIRQAYVTRDLYRGPYSDAAPDLILGFAEGYRASWEAASGKVGGAVFEDNVKAWSGDHCVDPELVPGVLFSNRKMQALNPGIEDMAPTALELFGVAVPHWMEGRSVFRAA